jgi:hypothetical protein
VLLLAGTFDFEGLSDPGTKAYLGEDASKYRERSPLMAVVNSKLPLFVSWAELDPPLIVKQSEILYANLCNKNRCPKKIFLPNHSHVDRPCGEHRRPAAADAMLAFTMAEVIMSWPGLSRPSTSCLLRGQNECPAQVRSDSHWSLPLASQLASQPFLISRSKPR